MLSIGAGGRGRLPGTRPVSSVCALDGLKYTPSSMIVLVSQTQCRSLGSSQASVVETPFGVRSAIFNVHHHRIHLTALEHLHADGGLPLEVQPPPP